MYISTISESKYQTFKQCRLKYRYRYVDRLPEPEGANVEALHFGSYIHKILEEGVKTTNKEDLLKIAEEAKGTYKVTKKYNGKDLICIDNFLKFNANLAETVSTEQVFQVEIKEGMTLNGVIDRVIKGKDGGYLVIDYKTSKREKTKVDLYQDTQLKGYVYAVSKLYNIPVSEIIAAHYYPLTNNFVSVQYSQAQISRHIHKIVDEMWKIRKLKKTDMCASKNEFCNWCQYKPVCPEFNSGLEVTKRIEDLKATSSKSQK